VGRAGTHPVQLAKEIEILAGAHSQIQSGELGEVPYPLAHLARVAYGVKACNGGMTFGRFQNGCQHSHRRRFARAIRSEQRQHFAFAVAAEQSLARQRLPQDDRRGEHVGHGRPGAVQVEEGRPAPQVSVHAAGDVGADRLEQRVARRDPFERRVGRQEGLVKRDLPVFAAEPAELGFVIDIGDLILTECQMVNQFKGSKTVPPQFTRGYGLVFGFGERKAMAMALVDRAMRAGELGEDVEARVLRACGTPQEE